MNVGATGPRHGNFASDRRVARRPQATRAARRPRTNCPADLSPSIDLSLGKCDSVASTATVSCHRAPGVGVNGLLLAEALEAAGIAD
jgi:hypothetical protein